MMFPCRVLADRAAGDRAAATQGGAPRGDAVDVGARLPGLDQWLEVLPHAHHLGTGGGRDVLPPHSHLRRPVPVDDQAGEAVLKALDRLPVDLEALGPRSLLEPAVKRRQERGLLLGGDGGTRHPGQAGGAGRIGAPGVQRVVHLAGAEARQGHLSPVGSGVGLLVHRDPGGSGRHRGPARLDGSGRGRRRRGSGGRRGARRGRRRRGAGASARGRRGAVGRRGSATRPIMLGRGCTGGLATAAAGQDRREPERGHHDHGKVPGTQSRSVYEGRVVPGARPDEGLPTPRRGGPR